MKKFLIYIFVLGAIIVSVFSVLEYFVRKDPNEFKMKDAYMKKNASLIKTLLVGHSGMLRGCDPDYMDDSTYNAAIDNQSLFYSAYVIKHYSPQMNNLETIVLSCNYLDVFHHMQNKKAGYQIYMGGELFPWYSKENFECLASRDRFVGKVRNLFMPNSNFVFKENGYLTNEASKNARDIDGSGYVVVKNHTFPVDEEIYNINVKALLDVAELCKQNEINLYLISTPSCRTYAAGMDKIQLSRHSEMVNRVLEQYPEVRYSDYSSDERFENADFLDAIHLNSQSGAPKFSRIIQDSINVLF